MNEETKTKLLDVLSMIREDAEKDATKLDGTPATGKNLGTIFGHVYASIDALAAIMQKIIRDED